MTPEDLPVEAALAISAGLIILFAWRIQIESVRLSAAFHYLHPLVVRYSEAAQVSDHDELPSLAERLFAAEDHAGNGMGGESFVAVRRSNPAAKEGR